MYIKRFFRYAELEREPKSLHARFSVVRTYRPHGFYGSGRHFCILSSKGTQSLVDASGAEEFVSTMKASGYVDTYDPYRNT